MVDGVPQRDAVAAQRNSVIPYRVSQPKVCFRPLTPLGSCEPLIRAGSTGRQHRRAAYISARIPPPSVVAREWLRPDAERATHIGRRVPPLTRITSQRLRPDTERPADLARRIPPLAILAIGRTHRRRRDRRDRHRGQRHHADGSKMANAPHYRSPLAVYRS